METLETVAPTSSLKAFFDSFDFHLITISIQPEKEGAQVPKGTWFDPKNRVRAIPPKIFYSDDFQKELQGCQDLGCAVYFLINEGNGNPADQDSGNLNCGKRINITHLKSLAIDTDKADFENLWSKLKEIKLAPHYVLESSSNKYHLYFIIKAEKAEGDNVLYWQALQHLLDDLIPDLDQSMTDINQVLRVPGFYNMKSTLKEPFRVRIHRKCEGLEPYSLKFLYDRLEAHRYNQFQQHVNGALNGNHSFKDTYNKFEFPKSKLKEGERRNTICRYIEHVMENILPLSAKEEDYLVFVDSFIMKYLTEADKPDFLEGGKRRQNIINYFNDQLNYRVQKHHAKESAIANQQFTHLEDVQAQALPDSFYLNFPGDLGMLVREITAYAPNLSLELCFAGALMISGSLKSETFRFEGAWPFVNGLIIAGTGAGKSTLKDIVERTLASCGLRGKYPQIFGFQNSVQSLHTALYTAGGSGTVIVDESGDYLQTITAKHAPGYAKALKKYFKESTTGKDEGTWLHPGGSLSYTVPAINGGMLSLWMLIQPDKFTSSLDLSDMADGFLPRFFVFNGKTNLKLTRFISKESGCETFQPSLDLKVYLESLVQLIPLLSVDQVLKDTEKEMKDNAPKAKLEVINAAKRDAVYVARSEARKMNNIKVTITDAARTAILNYLQEKEKEALKSYAQNGENDSAIGVYVRMEEMLMRLMCNGVTWSHQSRRAQIDLHLAEECIKFHRFQTDRFFSNELKEIGKNSYERDAETVLNALKKAFNKAKQAVGLKEILQHIRSTRRPKNISQVMKELITSKQIWTQQREHKKIKDRKIELYMPAISEDLIDS